MEINNAKRQAQIKVKAKMVDVDVSNANMKVIPQVWYMAATMKTSKLIWQRRM